MSARTRRSLVLFWTALFVCSVALQYANFVVAPAKVDAISNVDPFQLDGNAVDDGANDDWANIHANNDSADQATFITDGFDAGDDIFTGGDSKDINNTSAWLWKVGSVQDKDDIENAFAAQYTSGGDKIVVFGLDRYQTSGDATAGFWFFQSAIGKTGAGTPPGSPFSGAHTNGDILVVLDFTNGGADATAAVYKWNNGGLVQVDSGVECGPGNTDDVCAIANTGDATSPWAYTPKDGTNKVFPANAFMEGAINLSHLGFEDECFSTFLAETRSSQEETATLSDFALGSFDTCGSITIVKDAVPNDAQDFTFGGDLGNFSLDDDGNATLSNTKTVNKVNPGTYEVTETNIPSGWDLSDISCNDGSSDTPSTVDVGDATATIEVDPVEDVTCTFTNTKRGKIIVEKQTLPDGASGSFGFSGEITATLSDGGTAEKGNLVPGAYTVTESDPTPPFDLGAITCDDSNSSGDVETRTATFELGAGETVTCTFTNVQRGSITIIKNAVPDDDQDFAYTGDLGNFTLDDNGDNGDGTSNTASFNNVVPGDYDVSETDVDGWELTDLECNGTGGSSGSQDGSTASIDLEPGGSVTCTFTNTKQGRIIVEKQTNPDGSDESFDFDASYDNDGFSLKDGEQDDSGFLSPDTYSVSEDVPDGWDLTSATCDDGSDPSSIDLDAGETVTCTFTNTQRGRIVVEKQTDPDGDPTVFDFSASYDLDGFGLKDGDANTSDALVPGSYSVSESVPAGWDLISATCDDGSSPSSIELAAGETVTCTFTNQKDSNIVVVKQTLPDASTESFHFDADYDVDGFDLVDGGSHDSGDINPGTYSVSEDVPDGWDLTSATCDDGSAPDQIELAAGETVTCTFENTQRGTIIVEKQTSPDGATGSFTFTGDAAGSIPDGGQIVVDDLVPGTYTSTEADPSPNFDLGAIVCDDSNSSGDVETRTATFELDPGETVTCVFTNSQRGTITIIKNAQPDGAQDFSYTTTGSGLSGFTLDDDSNPTLDNTKTFQNLVAGSYSVTEATVAGWDLTSLECNGTHGSAGTADGATANITLTDGGSVTCVYVNSMPSIEIVKTAGDAEDGEELVIEGGDVEFTYVVTNTGPVSLVDIEVVDDNGTPDTADDFAADCPKTTLAAGESMICTATVEVTETRTNIAVASGESEHGTEVEDDDDAVVRVPGVSIDKINDDADGIVGHGQTVTYTIHITVAEGPVTDAELADTLPAGQTYVAGSQTSNPAATSFVEGAASLTWTWDSLTTEATVTYEVTIDGNAPAGDQTNVAEICVSELAGCESDDSTVTVPELTIDKSFTGNTGGEAPDGTPEAKEGDVLTYTLAYDITNPPVHHGVITDTLPEGLAFVTGSAEGNDEFSFVSFDDTTRTLTWTAPIVTDDGTVTYQVEVLEGAAELVQPLVNIATIDSDETDKDDDDAKVFVEPPPLEETATPKITLPPTSTLDGTSGPHSAGSSLMLVLLALGGFVLVLGFVTPVPERVRRRGRRR